ncbi:MAG: type II toxin-antitoxin system PemK/MazF family toxin [Myxococcota bacterium]
MKRHEIWWANLPEPIGRRPVLLLSRDQAYRILTRVTVAEVTTTVRHIPVEVPLGAEEGLPRASVANLDNIHAVAVPRLVSRIGRLPVERTPEVERALGYALDIARLKDQ